MLNCVYAAIAFSDVIVRSFEGRIFLSGMSKRTSPRTPMASGAGALPARWPQVAHGQARDDSETVWNNRVQLECGQQVKIGTAISFPLGSAARKKPATGSAAVVNNRAQLDVTDDFVGYVNDKNPTKKKWVKEERQEGADGT